MSARPLFRMKVHCYLINLIKREVKRSKFILRKAPGADEWRIFPKKMLEQATDEFRESVCKKINTSLDQIQKDVENLKSWIRSQPHLPQSSTNTMLTTYIIGSKNRMDQAKRKIDNYYTARGRIPDFYGERDPLNEIFQEVSREVRFFYVPKMSPDGYRVQMLTYATGDASKFDFPIFLKRILMLEDVKTHREAFNNGTIVIIDTGNLSFSQVLKVTPKGCKDIFYCIQDVLPAMLKRIIVINAPAFLNIIVTMIKPFMKKKLFQRICLHTEGYEVLERYFPRAMFPKDYGGDEDTSEQLNENWMRCLEANREWFMNEGSMTTDESKRVQAKPLIEQMEAFTAKEIKTFKNLCID